MNGRSPRNNEQVIPESVIQTAASGVTVFGGVTPYPEVSVKAYGGGQVSFAYQGHNVRIQVSSMHMNALLISCLDRGT